MIRFIASLVLSFALICSQASAGFLLNSFAIKGPLQFVGYTSATGSGGTLSVAATGLTGGIGSSIQSGDLVVVVSNACTASELNMLISGSGFTWTEDQDLYANSTSAHTNAGVHWTIATGAGSGSITLTGSGAGTSGATAMLAAFRNVNSTQFDVATKSSSQTAASSAWPLSITTVTDGALVLAIGAGCRNTASISAYTAPSGYTLIDAFTDNQSTRSSGLAVAYKTIATAGAESPGSMGNPGGTSGNSSYAITVAVRP